MKYSVAILGATGLVGRTMVSVLESTNFPVSRIVPLASENSLGKSVPFNGNEFPIQLPSEEVFNQVDIALFSAGATLSKVWAPIASKQGAIVIDNSSAFRMDSSVPLVVPEVNPLSIFDSQGNPHSIISNPNCSTIQMVVPLKPLHDRYKIKRIIVSTYQSVTGKGKMGLEALESEVRGEKQEKFTHFHPIAFNVVPQIDDFTENAYTKEEMKMVNETRKIMGDNTIMISPTTVRVPVYGGHSESVNLEFEHDFDLEEVFSILRNAPGVTVVDNPNLKIYPMPLEVYGKDGVFVGRIRRDLSHPKGLNLWIVSDNLRKGAATNAIQIAEKLIGKLIPKSQVPMPV
ncbi:MAG: aspartate-semialdehyde dehydrogenase [Chloroherpetonaceae bacterium]|nr:aspartate-semialdehyde dehydrogenase [Chloroherpetonaceae bacterium]